MTPAEHFADRIVKNRAIERDRYSGNAGMSLDGGGAMPDRHKQRATYAAVAELS
jgi:hypothetical protein